MNDMAPLLDQFAAVVRQQINASATDTDARIKQAELVTAILSKPILQMPEDLMAITGLASSAAYQIMKRPTFPATFMLGRKRYVRTEDFMRALPSIQTDA